ncbi:IS1595 family transposase, partial [Mycolicibacterium vanbaalenii PYR-1]|nr:IS1595 family transposase [Mycolicibacterium vanbaalenii PYR-1]
WKCVSCGRKTSVTAGTIFHRTRTPLSTWFAAIWLVTSQKNGASAKNLHDMLGLGSYETAWAWLHKLRRAMVR